MSIDRLIAPAGAALAAEHPDTSVLSGPQAAPADLDIAQPCSVALFVVGGIGNLGNDASLSAMLHMVRMHRPNARIICICGVPEKVRERFSIPAIPIETNIAAGRLYRLVNRLTLRQLGHARNWYETWRALSGVDVILIPGTGVLDDFGITPMGFPYRLLMWCAAARLRGIKLAFVSTGAGPITHPLSRWFMLRAARMADWRSYRDRVSQAFMAAHGIDDGPGSVYPDLVFALPLQDQDRAGPPCAARHAQVRKTIGVGLMNYYGWSGCRTAGAGIHQRYVSNMLALVGDLVRRGHRVRLLICDGDRPMENEFRSAIAGARPDIDATKLEYTVATTLEEHAEQIAGTDIVVGTRYHTVVAALALGRPTVSLAYADKFAAVMADFGQQGYCEHAERFDPDRIMAHIDDLSGGYDHVRSRLAEALAETRRRLARQTALLAGLFPKR